MCVCVCVHAHNICCGSGVHVMEVRYISVMIYDWGSVTGLALCGNPCCLYVRRGGCSCVPRMPIIILLAYRS